MPHHLLSLFGVYTYRSDVFFWSQTVQKSFAPRKEFIKPPVYGRSQDVHFPQGESGLVD